jgi:flagella basal body P-ring formation protein FlgA
MNHRAVILFISSCVLALTASVARADRTEITLRTTARVPFAAPVTLGDIASITGPHAADLAAIVIHDAQTASTIARHRWLDITTDDIAGLITIPRAALLLRGSQCRVRLLEAPAAAALQAAGEAVATIPHVVAASHGPTVLDHLVARLADHFDVAQEDVRLETDERYASTLAVQTSGRIVEIVPMGTSSTMPIAITIYEGDRIVHSASIRSKVEVRRIVTTAALPVQRREIIAPSHVTTEPLWVAPGVEPAALASIVGCETRTSLRPGQIIEIRDVEPPVVVRNGDEVTVRCITGSIVVRQDARAMGTARDGQRVLLRPLSGGRPFYARMNGRGKAVLISGDADELSVQNAESPAPNSSGTTP